MYQYRHYPIWGDEVVWLGDPIVDSSQNIKGIGVLFPYTDDATWHGMIKAGYLSINPLKLKYPDNTMSGTDFEVPLSQLTPQDFHRAIIEGFDPDIFTMYTNALGGAAELLGLLPECTNNYWLGGATCTSVYQEGESAEDCFARIQEEVPALKFLRSTIEEGDFTQGVQKGFQNTLFQYIDPDDEEVKFIDIHLEDEMKSALSTEMGKVKDAWGTQLVAMSDRICEHGLVHLCRKGQEDPQMRGEVTIKQEFLPMVSRWQAMGEIPTPQNTIIKISQHSAENYKTLVKSFEGADGYSIRPILAHTGEIVLEWQSGPYKSGQVVLGENDMMKISYIDRSNHSPSPFHDNEPQEIEMTIAFDSHKLAEIISEGITNL